MTNDTQLKVLVSVPSMGNPSFKTMQSLVTFASTKNFRCVFHYPEGSVIHQARNSAVQAALQKECTHLMFIDDDMVFERDAILRLIMQDKDIIGGLCFGRTDEMIKPIVKRFENGALYDYTWEEVKEWKTTTEVGSTGTGFLLIKTEVLKAMDPPFFYFANPKEFGLKPMEPPNYDLSEDTTFMLKAREKGYQIWVDPTILIGHHGTKVFQRPMDIPQEGIAIYIPTLGRFEKLIPLVKNIAETTTVPYVIHFATDEPEAIKILQEANDPHVRIGITQEDCKSYAKRINKLYDLTPNDVDSEYIFTGSNDIKFTNGWDVELLKEMSIPGVGVVAANDLFNPNGTNFLISRNYINSVGGTFDGTKGKVFHEYTHNFCDTELVAKAMAANAYRFAQKAIVEHNHPVAKKAEDDWVYQLGRKSFSDDQKTFESRLSAFTNR